MPDRGIQSPQPFDESRAGERNNVKQAVRDFDPSGSKNGRDSANSVGQEPVDVPAEGAATAVKPFVHRLRVWSDDDLHTVRSVRSHEPVYANPAELRADVRTLLDRYEYESSRVSQAYGYSVAAFVTDGWLSVAEAVRAFVSWRVVWAWKWIVYFVRCEWRGAPDGW